MVCERLMHFLRVQMSVTHQLAFQEQDRDLVAVTGPGRGLRVDIDHIQRQPGSRRECPQCIDQLIAQAAAGSRIDPESQREPMPAPPTDFTEWAMNSTVCAGTSPTAVT